MLESLFTLEGLMSVVALSAMEIVLGIDNLVFISILCAKLPEAQRERARRIGLALAFVFRIALLFGIAWLRRLTTPLFGVYGHDFSGRDLVLLAGGLFLVFKSTREIYDKVELKEHEKAHSVSASLGATLVQIVILDMVFSIDSVITAVGMVDSIGIIIVAMTVAMAVMLASARVVNEFIMRHPSLKVLALSFLLLIGVLLVAEGTGQHFPKGYIYFAMLFSFAIELLNLRMRRRPVA